MRNNILDIWSKFPNELCSKIISEFDENIPKYISILANTQIPCMTSFLGGIIAQEIIKTTGIYIPINQWQIFDFLEFLPNENLRTNLKEIPINRYTDEIAIFGEKIINDLTNTINLNSIYEWIKSLDKTNICQKFFISSNFFIKKDIKKFLA